MNFMRLALGFFTVSFHIAAATLSNESFYLVTTSQKSYAKNSSALADVSATSLFDPYPYYQPINLLRLISPGYDSLPAFALNNRTLQTISSGPYGVGTYRYNSMMVEPATKLQFLPEPQNRGNLRLKDKYLLTVGDVEKGWSICDGPLGRSVIAWKGNDTSCKDTYIHAVRIPPY